MCAADELIALGLVDGEDDSVEAEGLLDGLGDAGEHGVDVQRSDEVVGHIENGGLRGRLRFEQRGLFSHFAAQQLVLQRERGLIDEEGQEVEAPGLQDRGVFRLVDEDAVDDFRGLDADEDLGGAAAGQRKAPQVVLEDESTARRRLGEAGRIDPAEDLLIVRPAEAEAVDRARGVGIRRPGDHGACFQRGQAAEEHHHAAQGLFVALGGEDLRGALGEDGELAVAAQQLAVLPLGVGLVAHGEGDEQHRQEGDGESGHAGISEGRHFDRHERRGEEQGPPLGDEDAADVERLAVLAREVPPYRGKGDVRHEVADDEEDVAGDLGHPRRRPGHRRGVEEAHDVVGERSFRRLA